MSDIIVGMMWNRNEGDILEEVIERALPNVDSLFIADDGSTDKSWDIIQSYAINRKDKIEYIRNKRENSVDQGQRQTLLNEIRKRYKPENTWVQIIESDIMIVDTDIKASLDKFAKGDIGMTWELLNAARQQGTWAEADAYPDWSDKIVNVMPYAHWMETMLYTFRPLPNLYYDQKRWRPWPQGFSAYAKRTPSKHIPWSRDVPLLGHYGYRGPKHFFNKFNGHRSNVDGFHSKYPSWDLRSVESVDKTVSFFNGHWNRKLHLMSREGYCGEIHKDNK